MPKYEVLELSNINNEMHEAGSIVEYDGLPSSNLKPLDAAGQAKADEYEASNKARVALMIDQNKESGVGDPAKFMADMLAMQKDQAAQQPTLIANAVVAAMAAFFPNGVPASTTIAATDDATVAAADAAATKVTKKSKAADADTTATTATTTTDSATPAGVTDSASA